MDETRKSYRQVAVASKNPLAVTVGVERAGAGYKAAVWWESVADIDGDEAEYADVATAFAAAEAARALHRFHEVVVVLQEGVDWNESWGDLRSAPIDNEPIGNISAAGLSPDESYTLAAGIEAERDA
ncbi:hypothetical protein [Devosia beringensis]|uniref:hypothetical protein n=1 Tax=Devosia beringensis TaxID=2657486 RepID=UPI00186B5B89|nr:hypothetical protein [Devosia beringensis]